MKKDILFKYVHTLLAVIRLWLQWEGGKDILGFADYENPDKYGILYNHPVIIHNNAIKHICIHATGYIGRDLNISYEDAENEKYQICHIEDISSMDELIEAMEQWNQTQDVRIRGTLFDMASRIYSPVCRKCNNYSKVRIQRLQLVKQIVESKEVEECSDKFLKSNFLKRLREKTEKIQAPDNFIGLENAMDCQWWNFSCWER